MDLLEVTPSPHRHRYALCVAASKQARWDIERDVLRARTLAVTDKCLPDAMTGVRALHFLLPAEQVLWSQMQARTYARLNAAADRCMAMQSLQLAGSSAFQDEAALEALVRQADEKLKHADLFGRLQRMQDTLMPAGPPSHASLGDLQQTMRASPVWAVLAFALHIQLTAQAHYRVSLAAAGQISPIWSDVLLYHWKEEAQHAVLTEMAWRRVHEGATPAEREAAMRGLLALYTELDTLLQAQAAQDANWFLLTVARSLSTPQQSDLHERLRQIYRCQHLRCGLQEPRFASVLRALLTPQQLLVLQAAVPHPKEEPCA